MWYFSINYKNLKQFKNNRNKNKIHFENIAVTYCY